MKFGVHGFSWTCLFLIQKDARLIHQPEHHVSVAGMPEEDVRLSIAAEVAFGFGKSERPQHAARSGHVELATCQAEVTAIGEALAESGSLQVEEVGLCGGGHQERIFRHNRLPE